MKIEPTVGKRLLVVAGGVWQVPLIKKAKELGCYVINSNLYENSAGFEFSDASAVADVRDKEKNLQIAKQYNIQGVVTDQSDIAVPTVAYIADNLKLPSIGYESAKLFTNKFQMRQFCMNNGFPCPEFKLCNCIEQSIDALKKAGGKVIIKPVDSQSSRGIHIVNNENNIQEYFEDAKQYSGDGESVIVERYIEGTEFTVDGIKTSAGHTSLCISQKNHFQYNESIANELFFSHTNKKFDYELLKKTNDALINATNLPYGLTHAEYKFEDGKYYLIEMAARGGGTKIASDIVPVMSGVDNYKFLIRQTLGIQDQERYAIDPKLDGRCAVLKFLDFPIVNKPVKKIDGIQEIRKWTNVIDIQLEFQSGDIIKRAQDDRSRVGFYIAYEENEEKLRNLMSEIEETIKVIY